MSLRHHVVILLCYYCNGVLAGAPSVIIIGAGSAGMAAATKLLENSITDIIILEAENRTGGRIHTVSFCGEVVDLGAEYCYGEKGNVVYDLAKKYNILEPDETTLENNVYYSDGCKMDVELTRDFEETIFGYYETDDGKKGMSVGEAAIQRYKTLLLEKYKKDSTRSEIVKEGLRYAEDNMLLIDGSYSWFDVSADGDFADIEGAWDMAFRGVGYKTILDIITKSYPKSSEKLPIDDKIVLNSKVTEIIWTEEDQTVIVHTSRNTYKADYVIFTPSVGVLKRQKDKIFNPNLPPWKSDAIEALTFSSIVKIFVHFPHQWWNDGDEYFSFFWREADLESSDFPEGPTLDGLSWVTHIVDIAKIGNGVWSAWACGDLVPEIEKQPSDVLKSGVDYVLKKFLGRSYNVTGVDQVIKTSWVTNDNFRGGFVNVRRGHYRKGWSHQEKLGEPLMGKNQKPVLLFAGDGTHPLFYSTVHGAIETGYREAERIIKIHNEAK